MMNYINVHGQHVIPIKKLDERAIVPTRGSWNAAGWDLYALERYTVYPGETVVVHTGIAIEIPDGYFGGIYARSGLSTKQGLRPSNCTGVVDSDYRGEVLVGLHNDSQSFRVIEAGDRVAQLIIQKYLECELGVVDELSVTDRGDSGFGSTGK